jgi:hypothetical protein
VNNINLNNAIYTLLAIAAITAAVVYKVSAPAVLDLETAFGMFSKAVTVDGIVVFLFAKWVWKLRIFGWPPFRGWLVLTPNLNGTWRGEIRSTWQDPVTGKRPAAIPSVLTIKQSLFRLSCVIRTEEMTSRSFSAAFVINDDEQREEICYSYSSVPDQSVIERSRQHTGTALLEIDESRHPNTLCGHYWSDRKTTGELEYSYVDRKLIKCFPDDLKKQHPVSAVRNYES